MSRSLLDLPPELRNSIYEYALTHDRDNGKVAAVGLLAVSRQIHNESIELFRARSTFSVTVFCRDPKRRFSRGRNKLDGAEETRITGDLNLHFDNGTTALSFGSKLPTRLPDTINITIDYDDDAYPTCINHFLYALVSRLNSPTAAKAHKVVINEMPVFKGDDVHHQMFEACLPLSKLSPRHSLKVTLYTQWFNCLLQERLTRRTDAVAKDYISLFHSLSHKVQRVRPRNAGGLLCRVLYDNLEGLREQAESLLSHPRNIICDQVGARISMCLVGMEDSLRILKAKTSTEQKHLCRFMMLKIWDLAEIVFRKWYNWEINEAIEATFPGVQILAAH